MVEQGYRYQAGNKIGYYDGPGGRYEYQPGDEAARKRAKKNAQGRTMEPDIPGDALF